MHRLLRLAVTAALTLLATTASLSGSVGTASAAGVCGARTISKPFTKWLDFSDYFVVPSGTFETGSAGWTTTGSVQVVADQEPWNVVGAGGKALSLRSTSTTPAAASSPKMCITTGEQWVRFFYKDPGVLGAGLKMQVLVSNSYGWKLESSSTIWSTSAGWKVSGQVYFPKITDLTGAQNVQIVVTPVFAPATWAIDDVMIDPWVTR